MLGTGTWRDWIPRLPRPALALPGQNLFFVLVLGSGFEVPLPEHEPIRGFATGRVVAARNVREAEAKATGWAKSEWLSGLGRNATGQLNLEVSEVSTLAARFVLRAGGGFTLTSSDS